MDPNTTLQTIRELLESVEAELPVEGEDLATEVSNLVEWLDKGGFPPACWQR
ncbi:hypothetical protein [Lentzea tibetensis]|uniref:hypothetical protein n=1 Tax=Lentzea tibetensis TaxID=2591470 RepID=UPI001644BEDF|nr:hypothetical protein [Lentzea tibetensis]